MTPIPRVDEGGDGRLRITVSNGTALRTEQFDCIIDRDDFNRAIGVEVLGFNEQLKADVPSSPELGQPRWSYDSEVDAFYLHVREGRVTHQEKTVGFASFGKDQLLVSVEFRGV